MSTNLRSAVGIVAAITVGGLIAWAGSDGSTDVGSVPVFALCAGLAYAINWLAFIPANVAKTERFYDITGTFTYVSVTVVAVVLSSDLDARSLIVAAMVIVWTLRLGSFLFRRIRKDGHDGRFDEIKQDPLWFLMAWTLQGLWVLLTAAAALAIITTSNGEDLGTLGYIGIAVWIAGFAVEVVADRQKSAFRQDPANKGRFISTGLWARSRHPNYFGEIVLWVGIALIAIPVLSGWQWAVLISPVFVMILLTRISGIPMLERRADERWGGQEDYERYKATTPVLIPRLTSPGLDRR